MQTTWYVDDLFKMKMIHRSELKKFISTWSWEWFASFNFGMSKIKSVTAEKAIKDWARTLGITEKLQIAYFGVLNHLPFSHIHLFLFGKRNKDEKTLYSVKTRNWEAMWPGDAKIKEIYQGKRVIDYVVDQNMPQQQYELLSPYGLKHLRRHKLSSEDR